MAGELVAGDPVTGASAPAGGLDLSVLNDAQRRAVESVDGPVLVLAGAGSGKTRVICYRIAHLVRDLGVPSSAILAVTFTNKAAGEMKERVAQLTGLDVRSLWVSTFHSSCLRILRRDAPHIGLNRDFTIYDEGDSESLLKSILKEKGIDPREEKPASFLSHIGRAKDELLSPDQWLERSRLPRADAEKIHGVYARYQELLRKANALDFGDLIVEAVRLLGVPAVLEKYQQMFRYVLVDEYQDTNIAQCRLVTLLAAKHRNLCVVGDDDQSIYEWRGADRRNILGFEESYPDARVIVLDRNYRSTQPILDAATALIGHNVRIREKRLVTDRAGGARPQVKSVSTEYAEAEAIVAAIRANARAGDRLRDHAVFFRVHAQSRVVEEMLSASSLPYQLLSGVSFYQRLEIKDVMAYLKLVANPADDVSFRRVVNTPARGIGDVTVQKLEAAAAGRPLMVVCRSVHDVDEIPNATRLRIDAFVRTMTELSAYAGRAGVAELVHEVLSATKYLQQFDPRDPEEEERIENVREFLSVAEEFQSSGEDVGLGPFLERISLATDVDSLDPESDTVILSTLHAAKGLEFKHVFIVGCEETIFPHVHAYAEIDPKQLEEERRLAYVGFTRAKTTLTLFHALERRIYGRLQTNIPSRFLVEAGLEIPAYRSAGVSSLSPVRTSFRSAGFAPTRSSAPSSSAVRVSRVAPAARVPSVKASDLAAVTAPPGAASGVGLLSEGDAVVHHKFGRGTVLYVSDSGDENETVQVRFGGTVKTLMSRYANLRKA